MSTNELDLDAVEREWLNVCGPCDGGLPMTCTCATGDPRVPLSALVAEVRRLRAKVADAWDEGHQTYWRRGPDNCQCSAWSAGECGCGEYGTGELLSLGQNPYRQ